MIHKILVGIDGSDSALNAANYAIKLSKEIQAELIIIYVIRYSIGNVDAGILTVKIEDYEKERALELVGKIKNQHPDIKIIDLEPIGLPITEINKAIDNWKPNLFIIGHHTHHFLEHFVIGSIEKKLLSNLKIPLLIVPENYNSNI
jgi:nucleotide-binding universal stress UspA family protein